MPEFGLATLEPRQRATCFHVLMPGTWPAVGLEDLDDLLADVDQALGA